MLQIGWHCIYINVTVQSKLGSNRAMLASDVWIEKLAILSDAHEDAFYSVDPRSLTWTRHDFDFDLQPPSTGKMFVWSPAFFPEPGSTRYSSAPSITTVWSNYQTSCNDFFVVYITETVTLSLNIQNGRFDQFNFINQSLNNHVTNRSLSSLVKIAFSWCPLW